jgi:hypothetical protein
MKRTVLLSVAAIAGFLISCASEKALYEPLNLKLTKEEKGALSRHRDVVISGKTGAIKGSEADKHPSKAVCEDCGFPEGSLRQRMIIAAETRGTYSTETLNLLKARKDIILSGRTGEIKGSMADKEPKKAVCEDCGFPEGSLRQRMIIYSE